MWYACQDITTVDAKNESLTCPSGVLELLAMKISYRHRIA